MDKTNLLIGLNDNQISTLLDDQPDKSDNDDEEMGSESDAGSDEEVVKNIPQSDSEMDFGTGDEDDENGEKAEAEWEDEDFEPEDIPFTGVPMFTFPVDFDFGQASSKDVLFLFFTEDIMDIIIKETNDYAQKLLSEAPRPFKKHERIRFWVPLTRNEMDRFFGIVILMGLWKLPSLQHYWKKKGIYKNPVFSKLMPRNRFELILKCLHFTKQDASTTGDPLAKIRTILDLLRSKYLENRYPEKELALDESMIPWRGRLKCRQYIKNKKHKYGIKLYKICCKDGYVLNYLPYCGKNTTTGDSPKTEQIVFKLSEHFLNQGHTLYMDNYYNSVQLAHKLLDKKTYVVGTLRKNRKQNPKEVVSKKLKKSEVIWKRKGKVLVTKWKDRPDVLMISTKHKHSMIETMNKQKIVKKKPFCIKDYNDFMGGVDLSDLLASYSAATSRRSIKWYKKVFYYLLDTTIINAFLMAKNTLLQFRKKSIIEFRESLVEELIPELVNQNEPSKKVKQHNINIFPKEKDKKGLSKRCVNCNKNKIRKDTRYFCENCPDNPALCVVLCFKEWHSK